MQINNGDFLLTASEDGIIKIWNVSNWEGKKSLVWNDDYVYRVTPDNNCNNYFLVWSPASVQLWNAKTLEHCVLSKSPKNIKHTYFFANGKHLIVSYHHKPMELWNLDKLAYSTISADHSELSDLPPQNGFFFSFLSEDNRNVVEMFSFDNFNNVKKFRNSYGLFVREVDLRNIHSNSYFTDEEKALLRQYGAIID